MEGRYGGLKKIIFAAMVLLWIFSFVNVAYASNLETDRHYTFSYYGDADPSPPAYNFMRTVSGEDMGAGNLKSPEDFYITQSGDIYIADSGANRIVICDSEYRLINIINELTLGGEKTALNNPCGIFVDETGGNIYIADTNNARVLIASKDGTVLGTLTVPPDGIVESFQPQKVLKDISGNFCVISAGVNEGIMHFREDGEFLGFLGAPKVKVNLVDMFWRNLMTVAQREQTRLITPIIYSNINIDRNGILYTTIKTTNIEETQKFRKLSPGGYDITRSMGKFPPNGNPFSVFLGSDETGSHYKSSLLVDVVNYENGIFSVLDQVMGRVFTYDEDGNLMFAFGSPGTSTGSFSLPVAIEQFDNKLYVLDKNNANINVFTSTDYGICLGSALKAFKDGDYDRSQELYQSIINSNINSEIGYIGLGKNLLIKGDFKEAGEAFLLGNYRQGYSDAFDLYRRNVISENFVLIFTIGVLLLAGVILFFMYLTKERPARIPDRSFWGTLNYSTHIIFRPFDGFFDLKNEKRGSEAAATVLLVLFIAAYIGNKQYTGFLFNEVDIRYFSMPKEVLTILFALTIWMLVNAGVSAWIYGEGGLKHIYMYTCYALTPMTILFTLATAVSNILLLEEGIFYYFLTGLGIIWFIFLIFAGNMQVHQYSIKNNLLNILLSLLQIAVVLFLILVGISLYQQTSTFAKTVITEITLR